MCRRPMLLMCLLLAPALGPAQERRLDPAGDPLPTGAVARLGTVRLRHPDWIRSLAASPDGKLLASGGNSNVRVWELPSGRLLRKYPNARDESAPELERAAGVAFTAKGDIVASRPTVSGGIIYYDPISGKKLKEMKDYSVTWHVPSGKELRLPIKPGNVFRPVYTYDATTLVAGRVSIRRIDIASGKVLSTIRQGRGLLNALAISPDGKQIAGAASLPSFARGSLQDTNTTLALWDVETGKELRTLGSFPHMITELVFSGDGKLVAAGLAAPDGNGKTVVVTDTATGKPLDRPAGHDSTVRTVAFVAGTRTVVSADDDGVIRTWDGTTGKQLRESRPPQGRAFARLSPHGKMALWAERGSMRLHDLESNKDLRKLDFQCIGTPVFSPDGKYLAAWGENDARVWELASGRELPGLRTKDVSAVAFSGDAKLLGRLIVPISGFDKGRVEIIELATGREVQKIPADYQVDGLAFSPDGKLLATSRADQKILLWDTATGRKRWQVTHPASYRGPRTSLSFANPIAFSPDGKFLASGGDDHMARLWDVKTGAEVRKFIGHDDAVLALAFSADGKLLASASGDTTVLVWDVAAK